MFPNLFESIKKWLIRKYVNKKKHREYKSFFNEPSTIDGFGQPYNFTHIYSYYFQHPYDDKLKAIHEALDLYTGSPTAKINNYLRIGNPEYEFERSSLEAHVKYLDLFLSQIQLKDPVFVIRKVKSCHLDIDNNTKTISDKAFLSTSLNLDYNLDFDSDKEKSNHHTFIIIKVPKGAHVSFLESKKNNREEYELLLPRNSTIKIDKQYRFLNNKLIFGEIVLKLNT